MKENTKEYSESENKQEEVVIEINRISRTVKGGRRIRFRATVVTGNRNGKVGLGVAKASEVQTAVQKATNYARKHQVDVPITKGTIPMQVEAKHGSAKIIMKPAKEGTSLIAGSSIRPMLELAGIKNIVTKSLGSSNKINNIIASINAFKKLTD